MWVTPLLDSIFERLYLKFSKNLIFDFDDDLGLSENYFGLDFGFQAQMPASLGTQKLINRAQLVVPIHFATMPSFSHEFSQL